MIEAFDWNSFGISISKRRLKYISEKRTVWMLHLWPKYHRLSKFSSSEFLKKPFWGTLSRFLFYWVSCLIDQFLPKGFTGLELCSFQWIQRKIILYQTFSSSIQCKAHYQRMFNQTNTEKKRKARTQHTDKQIWTVPIWKIILMVFHNRKKRG